jgi:GntR family transcriptional regulator
MNTALYLRVKEWLREAIKRGDYSPGEKIPSEHELMERFGVARSTVRQAITELVLEGWLYKVQGRGTFVAAPKYHQTLSRLTSFTEDMKNLGLVAKAKLLSCTIEKADANVTNLLQIERSENVIKIERLRFAGDEPMALNFSILPYKFVPGIEKFDLEHLSLYEILEKNYGLSLARAEQTLEPTLADQQTADLLNVRVGTPLLLVEGIVYLKNGTPIEWTRILYRGDRYKFHIVAMR